METSSLISVRSKSKNIIIPSEETKVNMYPLDYEEFRWALGDTATVPLLRSAFEKKMSLGDAAHRKLMRDFRLYMLVASGKDLFYHTMPYADGKKYYEIDFII